MKKPGRLFPDVLTPQLMEVEKVLRAEAARLAMKAQTVRALRTERIKNLRQQLRQSDRRKTDR
jgi:hypothetical protein